MAEGWIKLHRQAIDTPELQGFVRRGVWDYLLLKAAHKSSGVMFRGRPVRVERGQVAVSIHALADEQGIGHKQLRNILDSFERAKMLKMDKVKGKAFTVLTINNFAAFQDTEAAEGQSPGQSEGKVRAKPGQTEQEGKNVRKGEESDSSRSIKSHRSHGANGHDRFTEFWQCWDIPGTKREPRRAEAKYRSLIRKGEVTHEELCDGVQRYMHECRASGREVQFIKHPTTWLNGGCWRDEERRDEPAKQHRRQADPDALMKLGDDE